MALTEPWPLPPSCVFVLFWFFLMKWNTSCEPGIIAWHRRPTSVMLLWTNGSKALLCQAPELCGGALPQEQRVFVNRYSTIKPSFIHVRFSHCTVLSKPRFTHSHFSFHSYITCTDSGEFWLSIKSRKLYMVIQSIHCIFPASCTHLNKVDEDVHIC